VLEILIDILYTFRRWRALLTWAVAAALIYPVMTYLPNHGIEWLLVAAIGVVGFAGGLYWEVTSGSN
jgi:hypothetical protein